MSRSRFLLLLLCPLLSQLLAASATAAPIAMSEAQIRAAGISLAPLGGAPDPRQSEGAALVLAGTVVPAADAVAVASAPVAGVVQQVHAEALRTLRAGAPLASLSSPAWMEQQREYVQAASLARLAADKLTRDESLYADGVIARARVEESRANARMAALSAEQRGQVLRAGGMGADALARLANGAALSSTFTVRAPYEGAVLELNATPGQMLEAGMPVARLVRQNALLVELAASARELPLLAVGDLLQVEGCGAVRIEAIGAAVNGASQTARIQARPTASGACLKLHAYVEARLLKPRLPAGAQLAPAAALVRRGAQDYVFVRSAQGFEALPVRSGSAGAGQVWIAGALPAGARVAVSGIAALKGAWLGLGESGDAKGAH